MTSLIRSRWAAIGAAVAVTLGAGGLISVNAANDTSSLVPITPTRILDTRSANRVGSLDTAGASDPYRLKITGTDNIPATGVTGVSLNVTAVDTQTNDFGGYVSVYPCASASTAKPDVSNINFRSGQTIANAVTVPVSADGYICLYVYGTAHLLVDANGYYTQTSATTGEQGPAGPVSHNCIAILRWDLSQCNNATIAVGTHPSGVASDGTNIYVTTYGDDTVSVIDPITNTLIDTIPVGDAPSGIVFSGANIYVANIMSGTVSVINPTTNSVIDTITVGEQPGLMAFTGANIYVTNERDNSVSVINPITNTVTDTITVGNGPVDAIFDGNNIYVTSYLDNRVSVIDPTTNTVTATITVGNSPGGAVFTGNNIYIANMEDGTVSVIDPTTNTVTTTITVGLGPTRMAFDGTSAYVTNWTDNTVSVINPNTNKVTDTITVGNAPDGIAFDGTNIYVTNFLDDTVTKLLPR
jgi:YVTN family beta-propeller protein